MPRLIQPALVIAAWAAIGAMSQLRAEIPLDKVQWLSEFGVPSAAGLWGRSEFVYLYRPTADGTAPPNAAHDRFAYYLQNELKDNVNFAAMAVGVDANFGSPSETAVERYARGNDSGGLLRAFAGDAPGVMLVFDPEGRLTELRACAKMDDAWFHSLAAQAAKAKPLIDSGWLPATLQPALPWFLAGDLKRFLSAASKLKGGDALGPKLGQATKQAAQQDAAVVADASVTSGVRLLALMRLQALAAEFPNLAPEAQKAAKGVKDDTIMKGEQAGWAAFLDYLGAMKREKGAQALEAQKAMLGAIVGKHPDTYAAEVAEKITAFVQAGAK